MSNAMEEMSEAVQRKKQFLLELAALTRKYGIAIDGCGCCNSPWLNEKADISDKRSGYAICQGKITEENCGGLRWVAPSNKEDWQYYKKRIVKDNDPT